MLKDNRSVRRFDNTYEIDNGILKELVGLTRYCASGRNAQPLKYRLVTSREECDSIFPFLSWAGYLTDWDGPEKNERPTGYLIQCLNTDITKNCLCDDGLQLETITLGATAIGLSCCIIKSFNKKGIKDSLHIPDNLDPIYVVAIGKGIENVVLKDMTVDGDIKYWRDENKTHFVPKRPLNQLLVE